MKKIISCFLLFLINTSIQSQADNLDKLVIDKKDLPENIELGDKLYTVSRQSTQFYTDPSYQGTLPEPVKKKFQTFTSDTGKPGSVLYFQYKSAKELNKVIPFLQGLLYKGRFSPSALHPEHIYTSNNILILFSFQLNNSTAAALKKIIERKGNITLKLPETTRTTRLKQCKINNNTTLFFQVPVSFSIDYNYIDNNQFGALLLTTDKSHDFKMLVTFGYAQDPSLIGSKENLKKMAVQSGTALLQSAVEKKLTVHELQGNYITGYCYRLTDRSPKPGEYKYLVQGVSALGTVLIQFTILTNDEKSPYREQGMEIIKSVFMYVDQDRKPEK